VAVLTLQFRRFTEEHLNTIMNKDWFVQTTIIIRKRL